MEAPTPVATNRQRLVDVARQAWIRRLVDMSRRNNLLYFRDLRSGTLDLSAAPEDAMRSLVQSGRSGASGVSLDDLVAREDGEHATKALRQLEARARSNFEERGLDTLFLALGLASWATDDGGRETAAPVLLVPLTAAQAGRGAPWVLRRAGDVKINDVLLHALREDHGIALKGDELLPEVLGDDEGEDFDLEPVFNSIEHAAREVDAFSIKRRWVLGNFAFQKMAIVNDLRQLAEALARHPIIAGIAGDSDATAEARGDRSLEDPERIDERPPEQEFLILDADSSQQQAIGAALAGQNGVMSGPPGTGKSQTIANLIAEAVARGRTVLFVAEKRAALDVVLERLRRAQLDYLCMDCHGAELTRRHIAEQLQTSLDRIRDAAPVDASQLHADFADRRDRLNAHVRSLHHPRQPGGLSPYTIYGRILRLPPAADSHVRLGRKNLEIFSERDIEAHAEQLREAASLAHLVTGESSSSWLGATFKTPESLRNALETVRQLAFELWPDAESALAATLDQCPIEKPTTLEDAIELFALLSDIDDTLDTNNGSLFKADLDTLTTHLAPLDSWAGRLFAPIFRGQCRRAIREVRRHNRGERLDTKAVPALVRQAREQLTRWRNVAKSDSSLPERLEGFQEASVAWTLFRVQMSRLRSAFSSRTLEEVPLDTLGWWLRDLAADSVTPAEIFKLHQIVKELTDAGLGPVWENILSDKPDPDVWPDRLYSAWLRSCLEEIRLQDPALAAFRGRRQDAIGDEFRRLDQERLAVAVHRVQRKHAEAAVQVQNRYVDENGLVAREAKKRSRHLPLRRLFAEAQHVLLALRPCWMASPLSVSQLIPGSEPIFDLVIFDEASQVLPEDAITSLLRGRQAVIAGDKRQLPPTTFFAAGPPTESESSEEEMYGGTEGFQSVLDVMSAFLDPPWSLDWHYRSRDERLITFSNHRIYDGRLVTFPSPGLAEAITGVVVPHAFGLGGQEASTSSEVNRVVDLVLDHARTRPDESLGVITMGIEHANRIEMALYKVCQGLPELDEFFNQDRQERFFIKNLERVQGDERDAIILSIGYGKNPAGQLVYRFGPLLQEGGERRLNVAITRARRAENGDPG